MITAPLVSKEKTLSVDDQREFVCALTEFAATRPLAQTTDWRYGLVHNADQAPLAVNYKVQPCRHCGTSFEVLQSRRFFCSRDCYYKDKRAQREREREARAATMTPETIHAEMVAALDAYREAVGS